MNDTEKILAHLTRIETQNKAMEKEIRDLDDKLMEYVTKIEFKPVQIIVYGIAGITMSSALIAVLINAGVGS